MEGLILLPEYGFGVQVRFGKVLGTQDHLIHRSASTHCVLHLNLVKGTFNIAILDSHTHTNIHLANKHGIFIPNPNIHLSCISYYILAYIYHTQHYITSNAETCKYQIKVEKQAWQDQNNMFTYSQQTQIAYLTSYPSYPQLNACTCECITYLTPPQYLCINAWSYECVFMAKQRKTIKEP